MTMIQKTMEKALFQLLARKVFSKTKQTAVSPPVTKEIIITYTTNPLIIPEITQLNTLIDSHLVMILIMKMMNMARISIQLRIMPIINKENLQQLLELIQRDKEVMSNKEEVLIEMKIMKTMRIICIQIKMNMSNITIELIRERELLTLIIDRIMMMTRIKKMMRDIPSLKQQIKDLPL